jgi:4,5-dihydroxyphthalate decarboxylase
MSGGALDMANLRLTLACGDYERMRALIEGTVRPEGMELTFIPLRPAEIFWRMMRHEEFDVAEMSASSYMIARDRGMPLLGIPVFPTRCFRHSYVFIRKNAGIKVPGELAGKRVGTPEYEMTAGLWVRGFLQHDYRVPPSSIRWFTGGQLKAGREEKVDVPLPEYVEPIPSERTLMEMLLKGDLDALVSPIVPQKHLQGADAPLGRLFEDFKRVEADYYRRTKIFPIMHMIVVKEALYKAYPWIAQSLYKAFCEAKEKYFARLDRFNSSQFDLVWFRTGLEESRQLLGEDLCPYGVENNRSTLEALTQYAYEQGLVSKKFRPEELVAPNTLDEFTE